MCEGDRTEAREGPGAPRRSTRRRPPESAEARLARQTGLPPPRWSEHTPGTLLRPPLRIGGLTITLRKGVDVRNINGGRYDDTVATTASPIQPGSSIHFIQFVWDAAYGHLRNGDEGWLAGQLDDIDLIVPASSSGSVAVSSRGGVAAHDPQWSLDVADGSTEPYYDQRGLSSTVFLNAGPRPPFSLTIYDKPAGGHESSGAMEIFFARNQQVRSARVHIGIHHYLVQGRRSSATGPIQHRTIANGGYQVVAEFQNTGPVFRRHAQTYNEYREELRRGGFVNRTFYGVVRAGLHRGGLIERGQMRALASRFGTQYRF